MEAIEVEPEIARHLVDAIGLEAIGSAREVGLEELVVHLPEFALLAGGDRGARGIRRVGMHRQRVVLEREAEVLAVARLDLLHHLDRAAAVGALEVGELDDGDLRLRVSLHRSRADRHLVDGLGTRRERRLLGGPILGAQRRSHRAAGVHLQPDEVPDRAADARGDRDVPRILHVSISSNLEKQQVFTRHSFIPGSRR